MLGDDGDATAAIRALARAEDAVEDAVRLLLDAEAVDWAGPGAARYRRRLQDTTDAVRRSRGALREAAGAVGEHAAAGRLGPHPAGGSGWLGPRWPAALSPTPPWPASPSGTLGGAAPPRLALPVWVASP